MHVSDHRPAAQLSGGAAFPHRHLTGIAGLEPHHILFLLDESEQWIDLNRSRARSDMRLGGITQINAFFEASTRTLLSFEIAGKRLGADVVNMHAATSSVKKGETLLDTAATLNAMRADVIVIRHGSSGAVQLISGKVDCPVLNAGDGWHEHPTQALLDALTIRRRRGSIAGQRVVICGDILHSRVARSNMLALTALAAEVRVCAPSDADARRDRADGRDALHRFRRRARRRRRGDDAAAPERADGGWLHPLDARIPPALRPHRPSGSPRPGPTRW